MADLTQRTHLFFDLDDTLWDFEKNSGMVLQQLFAEFELQQKLKTGFDDFHATYKRVNQALWDQYRKNEINKSYLRNQRFHLAFKAFDYDNYDENLQLTEHYLDRSPKGKALKEGCLETLDYLKQKNYQLHIITNGFKEAQGVKLDNCGLRPYFSHIIISEEHQLNKPDEKLFRMAQNYAGAEAADCVMIGDNFECDVQGPLDAGWEAVYFSANNEQGHQGHVIGCLEQLRHLF